MKSLEQSGAQYKPEVCQVNSVKQFYKKGGKGNRYGDRASGQHGKGTGTDQRCFNCNHTGHFAEDSTCPARDRKCKECGNAKNVEMQRMWNYWTFCCVLQKTGQ